MIGAQGNALGSNNRKDFQGFLRTFLASQQAQADTQARLQAKQAETMAHMQAQQIEVQAHTQAQITELLQRQPPTAPKPQVVIASR